MSGIEPGQNPSATRRLRRLRNSRLIREAVADVRLDPACLIYPVFVSSKSEPSEVTSMPDVLQLPVDAALARIQTLCDQGLNQFLLFGVTDKKDKDPIGSFAQSADAPVNQLIKQVRGRGLNALLYADLCLCEYTDHGHFGVLNDNTESPSNDRSRMVNNDRSVAQLALTAAIQAKYGANVICPSAMMDGQVAAVRAALDQAGFEHVSILSYCMKYASNLYDPFREAGQGVMQFGDRKGYQMDYRRSREWRSELEADLAEGADMVMVKPALAYLDIIYQVRQACHLPVVAYHVSGEYAMIHAAARAGWLDLKETALELTYAIKRAGADMIISYFAPQIVQWLKNDGH